MKKGCKKRDGIYLLPFYSVMDFMKLIIQNIQDSDFYKNELDRVYFEKYMILEYAQNKIVLLKEVNEIVRSLEERLVI